jgi:hypothetical protein
MLVVINSSKHADANHDREAAVAALKKWFEKSVMAEQGAVYESITAEETIDAENPEPSALYTEADLVSFGNYMRSESRHNRIVKFQKELLNSWPVEELEASVTDSDIAHWRHERELGESPKE